MGREMDGVVCEDDLKCVSKCKYTIWWLKMRSLDGLNSIAITHAKGARLPGGAGLSD